MSKSSTLKLLEDLVREVDRLVQKKGNKSVSRAELDMDVISYSVHEDVILDDISKKGSPFLVEHEYHGADRPSNSKLRGIAKDISKTMYNVYKARARSAVPSSNFFKIVNFELPDGFVYPQGGKAAVGYDDSLRLIFFQTPKKSTDTYEAFQGAIKRPVENILKNLPEGDATRIYISPSAEWVERKNIAQKRAEDSYEADYRSGKIKEEDYNNTKKKTKAIASRKGRLLDADRKSGNYNSYEGIQVGHPFGAAANAFAPLAENPHDLAHQNIDTLDLVDFGEFKDRKPLILSNIKKVLNRDTTMKFEQVFNSREAKIHITLTVPESKFLNQSSGGSTGSPVAILKKAVSNLKTDLTEYKGSPSYQFTLIKQIEDIFLGKKPKKVKRSNTVKKTSKVKVNIRKVAAQGAKPRLKLNRNIKTNKDGSYNLNALMHFLNQKLHDKIQQNMGKGTSRTVLNYRTGRFAKSAKIKRLLPSREKNTINAVVKYMRNPYGVFEPGAGKLATPGRSPAKIFGRSIRQLLQEEKISNLRRVKVTLSG